jgi:hypothetical protein
MRMWLDQAKWLTPKNNQTSGKTNKDHAKDHSEKTLKRKVKMKDC